MLRGKTRGRIKICGEGRKVKTDSWTGTGQYRTSQRGHPMKLRQSVSVLSEDTYKNDTHTSTLLVWFINKGVLLPVRNVKVDPSHNFPITYFGLN